MLSTNWTLHACYIQFQCENIFQLVQSNTGSFSSARRKSKEVNMAAGVSEGVDEKPTFTCASCGFKCHYEYFGKKPPFSKSIVYVYSFVCLWFLYFLSSWFQRRNSQNMRGFPRSSSNLISRCDSTTICFDCMTFTMHINLRRDCGFDNWQLISPVQFNRVTLSPPHLFDNSLNSHHLFAWQCIKIVRRIYILITPGS